MTPPQPMTLPVYLGAKLYGSIRVLTDPRLMAGTVLSIAQDPDGVVLDVSLVRLGAEEEKASPWPEREGIDEWHVLVVRPDHDPEAELMHPEDCPFSVTVRHPVEGQPFHTFEYHCATQEQINQAGYDGLFERHSDALKPGVWLVAPWIEECRGLDWVEYDGGWHVRPLVVGA